MDNIFKKKIRECNILMSLSNKHVVKCYDWWIEKNNCNLIIFKY